MHFDTFTWQAYTKGDSGKIVMVHIVEDYDLIGPPRRIHAICTVTVVSRP